MSYENLQSTKIPVILITIGILIFGFVCTGMLSKPSMEMSAMDMGVMSSEHDGSCCSLGTAHHINSLRDVVLISPDRTRDALALLALGLTLLLGYGLTHIWNRRSPIDHDVGRLYFYIKSRPEIALFDHLKLAFARGILNPKIY
jgi:hypothetical protein